MHYYIDGYNWLFRSFRSKKTLEEKRRQFLKDLTLLLQGKRCEITVVFDSSDPYSYTDSRGNFQFLEIIFTKNTQTADEYIELTIENAKNPKKITVVTLDRQLQQKCLLRGAHVLTILEFFNLFTPKKSYSCLDKQLEDSPYHFKRLLQEFEKKISENCD